MSNQYGTSWTEERIEFLSRMVSSHSAGQIAEHLGVPRNAVIGKAFRLGLRLMPRQAPAPRPKPIPPPPEKVVVKAAAISRVGGRTAEQQTRRAETAKARLASPVAEPVKAPEPEPPPVLLPVLEAPQAIFMSPYPTLFDLPNNGCRWPMGYVEGCQTHCGRPSLPRKPWCSSHAGLAVAPKAVARPRPMERSARTGVYL